jgi:arginyl-tRNA synthetase
MGMSTRRGNVKFLDDILDDVAETMHNVMHKNENKYAQVEEPQKVADILGISAVMVQDMSGKRINNYPFDIERMTSFEGDTGPYLQYAHARLCSIARKTGLSWAELRKANFSLLQEPHAIGLMRLMAQYPDMVNHAFKTLEPATILTYLFRLAHQLSSSYDVLQVVGAVEGQEVTLARAALYEAARQVIHNGMKLLGLNPVER